MSFDINQITQIANNVPYPIDKNTLVNMARQRGVNDQVVGAMNNMLPDQTFNSPQDLLNCIQGAGGGMGNIMGKFGGQQQGQQGWAGGQQQDQGGLGGWMGQQQDQGEQGQPGSF